MSNAQIKFLGLDTDVEAALFLAAVLNMAFGGTYFNGFTPEELEKLADTRSEGQV